MADLDEAAVNNTSNGAAHIEIDLSDETQDFRMLNNLSFLSDTTELSLPKRGEKDFEPNPTLFQADILSASRQAMHNALSYPRLHNPKTRVIGVYAPNGPAPPPSPKTLDTIAEASPTTKPPRVSVGVHPDSCVYVTNPKGQLFKTAGQADRWNRVWLLPEEALYLLERGSVDIRWPCCTVGDGDEDNIEDSGIPMSLQAAYACFIGHGGLTMERFSVYTGLRRLGYAITRAPGWTEGSDSEGDAGESLQRQGPGLAGIFTRFLQWLRDPAPSTGMGPVAGLGFHRSYTSPCPRAELPYVVVFHVYKPSPNFRKSAPPTPDFRIAVINARTHTIMPTMSQIGSLLESTPLDAPRLDRPLYARLRNGYRNVILAVVDQGVQKYSQTFSRTTPLRFSRTQRPLSASENLPISTHLHLSNRLSGQTCMITGGSSGIGFAVAERFLQEGVDRIILVGRSYERLVSAARQLERPALDKTSTSPDTESDRVATRAPEEDQTQGKDRGQLEPGTLIDSSDRISLLVGDVSEAAEWARELESAMQPVDILINAAGITISAVLPKTDPNDISKILRTNLEGSLLTSRALVRASIRNRMKNRSRAAPGATDDMTSTDNTIPSKCIINISSLLALKGGTGAVPYAASKAGILGLTRSLTVEAAKTLRNQVIRSNAIVPGYIETRMIADFSQTENEKLKDEIPLRRFGRPSEVADAAVFLAQNEYANNCVINLDGGLSAV
ncbi:hypothetical protein BDW59DRAFT_170115 [Aspergillus cavernicola]|uniref:Ketoreductase domain-containing protein n=1 Tax=Aspergillus cavernicola TaxID=176166 RepID=A0ABR4IS10_9EURO